MRLPFIKKVCQITTFVAILSIPSFSASKSTADIDEYLEWIRGRANLINSIQKEIFDILYLPEVSPYIQEAVSRTMHERHAQTYLDIFDVAFSRLVKDIDKDSLITSVRNILLACHSWAYLYEGFISYWFPEHVNTRYLTEVPSNFISSFENALSSFGLYTKWFEDTVVRQSGLGLAGFLEARNKVFNSQFKKGMLILPIIDKDVWVLEVWPSEARAFLRASGDYIEPTGLELWYQAVSDYLILQNGYYSMKDKLFKLRHTIQQQFYDSPDYIITLNLLNTYDDSADRYFHYLSDLARFAIFDRPMEEIGFYYYIKFISAKHWIDDRNEMEKAVLNFSTYVYPNWMASPDHINFVLGLLEQIKKSLGRNKYDKINDRAKMNERYFNLAMRIERAK
jgi:hypothetical protein